MIGRFGSHDANLNKAARYGNVKTGIYFQILETGRFFMIENSASVTFLTLIRVNFLFDLPEAFIYIPPNNFSEKPSLLVLFKYEF